MHEMNTSFLVGLNFTKKHNLDLYYKFGQKYYKGEIQNSFQNDIFKKTTITFSKFIVWFMIMVYCNFLQAFSSE